jgi:hypothetical protein
MQAVVVYDQNLLGLRAAGHCLEVAAAAAFPKWGLMRPLLAFLKDRLGP